MITTAKTSPTGSRQTSATTVNNRSNARLTTSFHDRTVAPVHAYSTDAVTIASGTYEFPSV